MYIIKCHCSIALFVFETGAFNALILLVGPQKEHLSLYSLYLSERCWHGYLSVARCRWYGPADAPLRLIISCFIKIHNGFTYVVPAYLGCPGNETVCSISEVCLYCFDTVGWASGIANGL